MHRSAIVGLLSILLADLVSASFMISSPPSKTTRPLPAICQPANFKNYRNFVDSRTFTKSTHPVQSKRDCCLTCYDATNCLSFMFDPTNSNCEYYTTTTTTGVGPASSICPHGVGDGYHELPGYPVRPGHYGMEYGPCLAGAPQGQGLGSQGGDVKGDEQILALVREEHGGENRFLEAALGLR